jgi:hypothetical protein
MDCRVIKDFVTPNGHIVQMKVCTDIPLDSEDQGENDQTPEVGEKKPPSMHGGEVHRDGILLVNDLNKAYNGCDCENPPPVKVPTPYEQHHIDMKCPTQFGDVLVEIETLQSFKDEHSLSQFLASDVEVIADNYFMCGIARTHKGQRFLDSTTIPECPQLFRNQLYARLSNYLKNLGVANQ